MFVVFLFDFKYIIFTILNTFKLKVSAYEKKIEQCNIIIYNDIRPRSLYETVLTI